MALPPAAPGHRLPLPAGQGTLRPALATGFVCLPDAPPGPAGGRDGVKWHVARQGWSKFPKNWGCPGQPSLGSEAWCACKLLRSPGAR